MSQKCVWIDLTDAIENDRPLMLEGVLFCPALRWCVDVWMDQGIRQFFIVCRDKDRDEVQRILPQSAEAVIGTGDMCRRGLPEDGDVVTLRGAALPVGGKLVTFTDRAGLHELQRDLRREIVLRHERAGVSIVDPEAVYIDPRVKIGAGTLLLPGTILRGETTIGRDCEIGPNTMVTASLIGDGCTVNESQVEESTLDRSVSVGPYAHIRPKCQVGEGVKVGAYVEIKNANFGPGTKMAHLTYVGDADVGARVNFGCGTITSNYDGFKKTRTVIGDDVFVGCNTNLVPPVTVGNGAYIAAGTTITRNVEPDSLAIGRVRQEIKPNWAKVNRELHKKR